MGVTSNWFEFLGNWDRWTLERNSPNEARHHFIATRPWSSTTGRLFGGETHTSTNQWSSKATSALCRKPSSLGGLVWNNYDDNHHWTNYRIHHTILPSARTMSLLLKKIELWELVYGWLPRRLAKKLVTQLNLPQRGLETSVVKCYNQPIRSLKQSCQRESTVHAPCMQVNHLSMKKIYKNRHCKIMV